MTKTPDIKGFQTVIESNANSLKYDSDQSCSHSSDQVLQDAANEKLDGCEPELVEEKADEPRLTDVNELLKVEIWKPGEPQYCRAICAHYGVKPRTVQKWFDKIVEVCPWFDEVELRLSDDRYTPLCIELMGDYCTSGLIARKWGLKIAERYRDRLSAWKQESTLPDAVSPVEAPNAGGLMPYSPTEAELAIFEPPILKTYRFTDKREFAGSAALKLKQGMDVTVQNTSQLDEALLEQLDSEGELLGVLMFQRKYGKAQEKFTQLQHQWAKKSGLTPDPLNPPPSGSAA